MSLEQKIGYSFDDVLLVPQYNPIESRLDPSLKTLVAKGVFLDIPIMATNMSTVTEHEMMAAMSHQGGVGVLHRFMSADEAVRQIEKARASGTNPVIASVGVGDKEKERIDYLSGADVDALMIDVAHGHSSVVFEQLAYARKNSDVPIIVGNVATYEAAMDFCRSGASGIRVGIGPGSRCTTRTVTGHGVPNLTALLDVVKARDEHAEQTNSYIPIIIDGGLRNSGDLVKALYFGADVGCFGGMFAGTKETPGEIINEGGRSFKKFYGMASKEAQDYHRGGVKEGTAPEGFSELVPCKGDVSDVVNQLVGGLRSGLTYSGAYNIGELRSNGDYRLLTAASQLESKLLSR